ncbi:hypothetical protein AcV5_005077 [Taiwanofungus camphoratus]|nr:hypothetical protein AcV5_005077 [Antrodia cinnamomea]
MSLILGKRRHSCLPGDSNHVLQPLTKRARSAYDRQSFHDSGRTTSQAVRIYYSQPQVRESVAAGRQNEAWLTEDCEKHASAALGLGSRVIHSGSSSALRIRDSQPQHASGSALVPEALSTTVACASATYGHDAIREVYKTGSLLSLYSSQPSLSVDNIEMHCSSYPNVAPFIFAPHVSIEKQQALNDPHHCDCFCSRFQDQHTTTEDIHFYTETSCSLPQDKNSYFLTNGFDFSLEAPSPLDRCSTGSSISSFSSCEPMSSPYSEDPVPLESAPWFCSSDSDGQRPSLIDDMAPERQVSNYSMSPADGSGASCAFSQDFQSYTWPEAPSNLDFPLFDSPQSTNSTWNPPFSQDGAGSSAVSPAFLANDYPDWSEQDFTSLPPSSLSSASTNAYTLCDGMQNETCISFASPISRILPHPTISAQPVVQQVTLQHPRPVQAIPSALRNYTGLTLDHRTPMPQSHDSCTELAQSSQLSNGQEMECYDEDEDDEDFEYEEDEDIDIDCDEEETEQDDFTEAEGIEVGPSIGLGSSPRTLDSSCLLLQPISETVRTAHESGYEVPPASSGWQDAWTAATAVNARPPMASLQFDFPHPVGHRETVSYDGTDRAWAQNTGWSPSTAC